jgi:hypothetical protein
MGAAMGNCSSNAAPSPFRAARRVALVRLLRALVGELGVIVLNASFSVSQAEELAECVDCTVGTSAAIGDRAAIVFAGAFYRAVGYGGSIRTAFEPRINAMQTIGIPEDATPRFFTRDGRDASKVVLIPS